MSAIDEILNQVPMDQLAAELNTDPGTAEQAARAAIPQLLGAVQNNANDPQRAQGLASALGDHQNDNLLEGGLDINQVDQHDGQKMVGHLFGGQQDAVAHQAAATTGGVVSSDLMKKLLPILAPIVIAYVVNRMGPGLLSQILGGMFGGGQQTQGQQTQQQQGGGLGSILGQILGGGFGAQPGGNDPFGQQSQQGGFGQQSQGNDPFGNQQQGGFGQQQGNDPFGGQQQGNNPFGNQQQGGFGQQQGNNPFPGDTQPQQGNDPFGNQQGQAQETQQGQQDKGGLGGILGSIFGKNK